MNYEEALLYIHGTRKFGSKLGLDNIRTLLELLDNPQKSVDVIHIAGTNGKGSTSSFISNILIEEGYKIGLFTSPYLEKFTERIRINNEQISESKLAIITELVQSKVEEMLKNGYNHPTEFEIVTAIAFQYYKEENVDIVVLEVGLGGRYDSTNIVNKPLAAVITPISMDHTDILGDTIEKIAWEKAGIIKEQGLVISHSQKNEALNVIKNVVNEENGELVVFSLESIDLKESNEFGSKFDFELDGSKYEGLEISLLGKHQVNNASLALTTLIKLKQKGLINLRDSSIIKGLKDTKWKGRLELINTSPRFIIDGAHNPDGASALKQSIIELFDYKRLILGIGMMGDKDIDNVISQLATVADSIIVTQVEVPRAIKAIDLADKIKKYNENYIIETDIEKAVEIAFSNANEDDLIVFSGSLYLIGDIRRIVRIFYPPIE